MFSVLVLGLTFSHPRYTPMIKAKPAALPSCCVSTHSLIAIVAYTVEVTLPATPPAVSSGESATLRLPLSIINDDALQTHAAERPRGRAVLYLFSIEHAEQRWGGGSPGPLSVCVRASSHTWVGGHHHEETDHRVHAFATKPSEH